MPHTEAVRELIAAAESLEEHMLALAPPFNRLWDTQEFHRLRRARLAVKAEEKPRRFCRQPLEASAHQIGGNNEKR
jgi:hypothetical protein